LLAKLGGSCLMVHRQEKFPWRFSYIPWRFLAAKKFLFCGSVSYHFRPNDTMKWNSAVINVVDGW
jgi:hypothetical protein